MARFHLRLSDAEFWALTPRQFHLLVARHREESEHQQYLAGLICSTIANFSLGRPKRPLVPDDFMPARAKPREKKVSRRLIAQNVRCFLMGRIESGGNQH